MSVLTSLTPRERVMVIGGGAILIAALAINFVWRPLRADLADTRAEIAAYMQVKTAARTADLPTATIAPVVREPAATRVTRTARAAGLTVSRLEPEGALLNVTFGEVPYDALIGWLAVLDSAEALGVRSIEIDRRVAPGMVSARVTLEDL